MTDARTTILVVEDDGGQRRILVDFLGSHGFILLDAPDAETGLELLESKRIELVLMDVRMPGMGGLAALRRISEMADAPPVILLTAFADVRDAVEAMRQGAVDYLQKPVDLEELATVIDETLGTSSRAEVSPDEPILPDGVVVASDAMRRVIRELALVAPTEATVLITGESGTGKEKVAECIHALSHRSGAPLVRVNCAALPENLIESELFGHRKGAFTGAEGDRVGRFEAAEGGTLLLDEVGDLPLALQPKLLRVLEDGSFERVGESTTRRADVRVIASTNSDLEDDVAAGEFREDLFWRLNVFRVHVPPLRERREEVAELARAFLARGKAGKPRLSPAALRLLESHEWPGNVRELAGVIERASILAAGEIIVPDHLPTALQRTAARRPGTAGATEDLGEALTVEEAERIAIRNALDHSGGNRTKAAKMLGISRRTLLYRLKRYGGDP